MTNTPGNREKPAPLRLEYARFYKNPRRWQWRWLWQSVGVVVAAGLLFAVMVPKMCGCGNAKIAAALADVTSLKTAVETFNVDNGRYPTTTEGLDVLVNDPGDLPRWTHQYIEKVPVDPWGNPYVYRIPGANGAKFDIYSCGRDGVPGTADDITGG